MLFKHTGTAALQTERLILRRFDYSDIGEMLRNWIADPAVQFNYGEPVYDSEQAVRGLLDNWIYKYADKAFYRWAIILKASGENIGQIAFCRVYTEFSIAEIEYCIGTEFWGKGYTTEALKKILKFSYQETDFEKLEAFHRISNAGSGRVLEKSGMLKVDNVKRFELADKQPMGEVCYALTREEYFSNKLTLKVF